MNTAPFRRVVVAALALVLCPGCERTQPAATAPAASPRDTVAVIDGKPISTRQLQDEMARAGGGGRAADLQQVLNELIQREQLLARARRLGLDRDPEVQRAIDSVLIAKLKERVLEPALRAGTNNVAARAAAPASPAASVTPKDQVRLAILRLDATPRTSAEKRARLEARLQEARTRVSELTADTVGFGALAYEYSEDAASRLAGGDLGWMEADPAMYNLDPEAMKAGFALRSPGDISAVVSGRDGLYLVRLIARRTGAEAAEASRVRDRGTSEEALVVHRRHLENRKRIEGAFHEETRQTIPVTLYPDAIARVLTAVPTNPPVLPGLPSPSPAPSPRS